MRNNSENIARAVKQARTARRWSIRDACAAADISTTTWINAEKGMRLSELSQAAIAEALDWPANAFERLQNGESLEAIERAPSVDDERDPSWDDLKSSLSEADRAAVRAIIEALRAKNGT